MKLKAKEKSITLQTLKKIFHYEINVMDDTNSHYRTAVSISEVMLVIESCEVDKKVFNPFIK